MTAALPLLLAFLLGEVDAHVGARNPRDHSDRQVRDRAPPVHRRSDGLPHADQIAHGKRRRRPRRKRPQVAPAPAVVLRNVKRKAIATAPATAHRDSSAMFVSSIRRTQKPDPIDEASKPTPAASGTALARGNAPVLRGRSCRGRRGCGLSATRPRGELRLHLRAWQAAAALYARSAARSAAAGICIVRSSSAARVQPQDGGRVCAGVRAVSGTGPHMRGTAARRPGRIGRWAKCPCPARLGRSSTAR